MWRAIPLLVASILITSTLSAQEPCESDETAIVAAIYQQVLERNPDPASRIFIYDLASGRGTVRSNVAEVALSVEHQERFLWPGVAEAAFRATRNARPETDQVDGAVRALALGRVAVPDVVSTFAAEEAMTAPPPLRVLVLYKRLLSREPDDMAPRYEQMAQRMGVGRLSQIIVASEEYASAVGRHGIPRYQPANAYAGAVRMLYRHLLAREPDAGGLRGASEFAVANGLPALIPYFLNSPEYVARFGDNRVPGPGNGRLAYCRQP